MSSKKGKADKIFERDFRSKIIPEILAGN